MDPDANLARQLALVAEINRLWDNATPEGVVEDLSHLAYELAEHVEALNEWITRGGYLPAAWRK